MQIAFHTLGCKVNHYETEALITMFKHEGYTIVPFSTYADIYVINTCTVTNQSDVKSRKKIRQAIKKNPEAIVAVIGCYAQVDQKTIAKIDGVDIIMGTTDRSELLHHIKRFSRERERIEAVKDITHYNVFDKLNVTSFKENTRAYLKIQDGCNAFCSYCIIPYARGRIRSRGFDEVLEEARKLIKNHYKEIVLTGIHTGGYGSDLDDVSFYDLLKALKAIPGLKRLRISSIEINQLSQKILDLLKDPIFAKHLHIPLQHGDDGVLKHMRRRYDVKTYLAKLKDIRATLGDIAITTDVITGYPTEDDAAFETMKETLKKAQFSELHIFPYSKRSGTKAAQEKSQVHGTIKSLRVGELLKLNETLALDFRHKQKPQTQHVLFEKCQDDMCFGHSERYLEIKVQSTQDLSNQIKPVQLLNVDYPISEGRLE